LFFEWRPPLGGAEQGLSSVLNLDGSPGPAAAQFRRLRHDFDATDKVLAGSSIQSQAAAIMSYDNMWAEGFWLPNGLGYDARLGTFYRGLRALNLNIDVTSHSSDFSQYKLLLAPGLRIVSDELIARLDKWVAAGGVLILTSQAGAKDLSSKFRPVREPGVLGRIAGLKVISSSSSSAMAGNLIMGKAEAFKQPFEIEFASSGRRYALHDHMDRIELDGATALATYRGGLLDGVPAITQNSFGRGRVIFVGTDSLEFDFHQEVAALSADIAGIKAPFDAPPGVVLSELTLREGGKCIFAINYTSSNQKIDPGCKSSDLISGKTFESFVPIPPYDAMALVFSR
jgi:beta-galactosidase